jgi:hypothetical protein
MRKAAKWLVIAAIVVIVTAFTGIGALASDYDAQADSLKELGLFNGTGSGYELDRIPTRAEAAVSLVRLLGKEAEAKAGTYTTPFTDVPDWAAPYVGYLYTNGLAKGTSDTTFGSSDKCSGQMFTAFVLRALGYSESGGDFTYVQAQQYAVTLGLTNSTDTSKEFKRDNMVALSYSALFQTVKSGSTMLIEKLVSDKAVDAAVAGKYLEMHKTYQEFGAAVAKSPSSPSQSMSIEQQMQMKIGDETQSINSKMELATIRDGNKMTMRMDSTSETDGKTQKITMYYADGWMYMGVDDTKYKYKAELDADELSQATQQSDLGDTSEPFYLIDSITKT